MTCVLIGKLVKDRSDDSADPRPADQVLNEAVEMIFSKGSASCDGTLRGRCTEQAGHIMTSCCHKPYSRISSGSWYRVCDFCASRLWPIQAVIVRIDCPLQVPATLPQQLHGSFLGHVTCQHCHKLGCWLIIRLLAKVCRFRLDFDGSLCSCTSHMGYIESPVLLTLWGIRNHAQCLAGIELCERVSASRAQ